MSRESISTLVEEASENHCFKTPKEIASPCQAALVLTELWPPKE